MKTLLRLSAGWALATVMVILRFTCRLKKYNDPRPALKESGTPYSYSILHAHQVGAAINREKGTAAMVSASADGALLMPGFWVLGIQSKRGSNRKQNQDKGGRTALKELVAHVQSGPPAIIAVDGPRGPRNHVRKGIAVLSRESGCVVVNVVMIPTRRWVFRKAWDRIQIPKPFCRIDAYFGEPLFPSDDESAEEYRKRIEQSLNALEREHDPEEAKYQPEQVG